MRMLSESRATTAAMRRLRCCVLIAIVPLVLHGCGNGRYEMQQMAEGRMLCRLDTRKGEVVCFDIFGGMQLMIPSGGLYLPEQIPDADRSQLEFFVTGIKDFSSSPRGLIWDDEPPEARSRTSISRAPLTRGQLTALIYNPTAWTLKELRVRLSVNESAPIGTFRAGVHIAPESVGTLSLEVVLPGASDPLDVFGRSNIEAKLVSAAGIKE